ncbi:signal peptidase complex subunit 3 [Geospiza fortis]|uniref:Signal peptidase complex subunit 3 n=1 Tax=Geospiza fortis TaxID=48883 RepID=A0A8N5F2L8_GEOFO|nr:signal peptidase complex subunit 3 [Geospiza fortis]
MRLPPCQTPASELLLLLPVFAALQPQAWGIKHNRITADTCWQPLKSRFIRSAERQTPRERERPGSTVGGLQLFDQLTDLLISPTLALSTKAPPFEMQLKGNRFCYFVWIILCYVFFPPRKNVEDFTGPRERSDLGFVTFDITADLQSIFDWNVKQLFLYLSAEYSTKNNALNQVVLWDKIMLRGDNPRLSLKDMKSKYFFFDDGNGLKGNRNITLTLSWNVVPNAGILPLVTGSGHVSVPFPDTYETTKSY